jgi:putative SOS response-associated peptidase YedK
MCGRYTITISPEEIEARYKADFERKIYKTNYNAAPSQNLPVITNERPGVIDFFQWGLIPFWTKEITSYSVLINSRAETIKEKSSFKSIFAKRRCLVISDGFYEWKKEGTTKQPFRIILRNNESFAFAGLWDRWVNDGDTVNSFSIITTEANLLVKTIHNRMPVILKREDERKWLDSSSDYNGLLDLLQPYDHENMKMYPVSPLVNSIKNNSVELVAEFNNKLSLQ